MYAESQMSADLLKEALKKNAEAISAPRDGPMGSDRQGDQHPARLCHLRGQRDLLSLPSQGRARKRAHCRLAGAVDQHLPQLGFRVVLPLSAQRQRLRWNQKRVYRIYRELELNLRIKPKKRLVRQQPEALTVPERLNEVWSMDFMHDRLSDGRSFRLFNVLDDYNREGLGIEGDLSLPSARVIRSLEQIIEWRGKPGVLRCDNGPELISGALMTWARAKGIRVEYIQPGKPQQNAYFERYNRTVRYDWLSQYLFESIEQVQQSATEWLWSYNHERPNMALGGITPIQRLAAAA